MVLQLHIWNKHTTYLRICKSKKARKRETHTDFVDWTILRCIAFSTLLRSFLADCSLRCLFWKLYVFLRQKIMVCLLMRFFSLIKRNKSKNVYFSGSFNQYYLKSKRRREKKLVFRVFGIRYLYHRQRCHFVVVFLNKKKKNERIRKSYDFSVHSSRSLRLSVNHFYGKCATKHFTMVIKMANAIIRKLTRMWAVNIAQN